jgi:hypothetical protein
LQSPSTFCEKKYVAEVKIDLIIYLEFCMRGSKSEESYRALSITSYSVYRYYYYYLSEEIGAE